MYFQTWSIAWNIYMLRIAHGEDVCITHFHTGYYVGE